MNNLPTMAIDSVDIIQNESNISNSSLVMQVSMIPLEGDISDQDVTMNLDVTNRSSDNLTIYSKDLLSSSNIYVAYHDIPITVLSKNKALSFTAVAKKGTGELHAKWRPVTIPIIKMVDNEIHIIIETINNANPILLFIQALELFKCKFECDPGVVRQLIAELKKYE
tara:strand:- start:30 stop:530 length:501 start_codon:yes stop_codon:yes gene_type:complete